MTVMMIKLDFSCQGEGLLSLLFENGNVIKADRCNINQLNNNIFEQHQYCFCHVVILEVLPQRLTDKLVLSWLLVYTSFVLIFIFFYMHNIACCFNSRRKTACSLKLLKSAVYATVLE